MTLRDLKSYTLILGHAQHGKDHTAAALLEALHGHHDVTAKFTSSSTFACERCVLPVLGPRYGYKDAREAYEDRHAHRDEWYDLISGYTYLDGARLAREMRDDGNAFYVGMRSLRELRACVRARLFDRIVWVHRPGAPLEPPTSMGIMLDDLRPGLAEHVERIKGWANMVEVRGTHQPQWMPAWARGEALYLPPVDVIFNPGPRGTRGGILAYHGNVRRIANRIAKDQP